MRVAASVLAAIMVSGQAMAADDAGPTDTDLWAHGTAFVAPAGRVEGGFFQPLRAGLRDRFEISTWPLLDPLMPNAALKVHWLEHQGWHVSTLHDLSYPTPLLRALAHRGSYGLIAPDEHIPQILALDDRLLLSSRPAARVRVTAGAGLRLAQHFGGEMEMQTIDLPMVFPRTSAWHQGAAFQGTFDLEGNVWKNVWLLADVDLFVLNHASARYAFEHRGVASWKGRHVAAHAGYKYVYGQYPFGDQRHLLPYLDVQLGFGGGP